MFIGFFLVERDYVIFKELDRWRFCLGRHLKVLAGFSGERACNRRLKVLLEAGYISRKKMLYGVPYLYSLTHRGKMLIGANKRKDKLRIAQIPHDITALDTAIFCISKYKLALSDIQTEKQLHSRDGFSTRKHYPDFVFESNGKKYCVEVELSLKPADRLNDIIKHNYEAYDFQLFFVEKCHTKLIAILKKHMLKFSNIKIHYLHDDSKFDLNY